MDIYSYITKDHRKVSGLMEQVLAAQDAKEKDSLFRKIKEELSLHAESEESTFYEALKYKEETQENIEDAEDDHDEIRDFLEELALLSAKDEKWMELFGEFKHAVEHHVHEEENRIFDKARTLLDSQEEQDLARQMDSMKKTLGQQAA